MKPMLAGKCEDIHVLKYPVMASVKLDGVRAIVIGGKLMSRTLKPIPNRWCQLQFAGLPDGTDGELIFGEPTAPDAYRQTVSAVMSEDGEPVDVKLWAFDNFNQAGGFQERFNSYSMREAADNSYVKIVQHRLIYSAEELSRFEEQSIEAGYEGVMVRSLSGPYKQGRSTAKEGYLLKVKRFQDAEARIDRAYEWETNLNEAKTNALGRTERSSHQENKVGAGVLGGFEVTGLNGPYKDVKFKVGSGFQGADDRDGERGQLWRKRDKLIGLTIKYKYFASGSKDKPRFPGFVGFRDKIDY